MAICDLCCRKCSYTEKLLSSYQVPGGKEVCDSCARELDDIKSKLLCGVADSMRKEVKARVGKVPTVQRSYFRWLPRFLVKTEVPHDH